MCSGITSSCWLRFTKDYAPLDLAFVDIEDDNRMLHLLQLSTSSFPQHNRGSTDIQRLFYPPEKPQLASLLENLFGETGFQVSVTRDESNQIIDFEVLDPNGISCRNRISIFYVTLLYKSDAGISYAPKFVGFGYF
eukprot:jgi/Galph1/2884/GphlegSOOS_G38.1